MLALGYDVTAIDLCTDLSQQVSGFRFILGDFAEASLEPGFDVVVLCSVVEHIGLSGRYGSREHPEGDLAAMRKVRSLLNPEGVALLTVPVGSDVVHRPWHRVYGRSRLPELLRGFEVVRERFLVKQPGGPWLESSREQALSQPIDVRRYALGEFVLRVQEEA
jgi:SAM-dependent methyltransferase